MAYEIIPSYDDLTAGYLWYRHASPVAKSIFRAHRRHLIETRSPIEIGSTDVRTTGSTGKVKLYKWGPNYLDNYSFYFNNIVRTGSQLNKVAVVTLITFQLGSENGFHIHQLRHPIASTWLYVYLGRTAPIPDLQAVLAGHDIIAPPSHLSIMDTYCGFLGCVDKRALILSTGEAPTDDIITKCRNHHGLEFRDWMRCWDGGASFYTCQFGNKHWCDFLADVTITDNKLISTDLFNVAQPFVDYHNGDLVTSTVNGPCQCGEMSVSIDFANRQDYLYFTSPNGTVLTYEHLLNFFAAASQKTDIICHNYDNICFGLSDDGTILQIDCIDEMTDSDQKDLRAALAERGAALGFIEVRLRNQLSPSRRKLSRLYAFSTFGHGG